MLPNVSMYCCLKCCHKSVVLSHTLSPISSKSPSMRTIGSACTCLSNFFFFLGPIVLPFITLSAWRECSALHPTSFWLVLFLLFSMLGSWCFDFYCGLSCIALFIGNCFSKICFRSDFFLLLLDQLPPCFLCCFFPFLCSCRCAEDISLPLLVHALRSVGFSNLLAMSP